MEDVQTSRLAPRFCGRRMSAEDAVPDEWPRPNTSIGDLERSYSLRMTMRRNHQAWFTKHVRSVYGYRCAFSNLPLGKLLASVQGLDGTTLRVPQMREARPDSGFLEWRFDKFKAVQE